MNLAVSSLYDLYIYIYIYTCNYFPFLIIKHLSSSSPVPSSHQRTTGVMLCVAMIASLAVTVQPQIIRRRCCSSTASPHGSKKGGHLIRKGVHLVWFGFCESCDYNLRSTRLSRISGIHVCINYLVYMFLYVV
jgi:hypothetical protein